MMPLSDIVIVSAVRTPLGRFGGALRGLPSYALGAAAMDAALSTEAATRSRVGEVLMGSCRQAGNGLNPARTAALLAGLGPEIPAMTVNMACPSGMKAIMLGARSVAAGDVELALVGGMDSMSTIPHLVRGLRFDPVRFGDLAIEDGWKDATDPFTGRTMGQTGEQLAKLRDVSRLDQDEYALVSHRRALAAQQSGAFDAELSLVWEKDMTQFLLDRDEAPRADTDMDKLARLAPAFVAGGSITAGNACAMADGAAALLVTTREHAQRLGLTVLASLVAFGQAAVEGELMGRGPEVSIPMALRAARLSLGDLDLVELNEAFAAQVLANARALHLDLERLNVNGGAIALGHPTGTSGARIVVTLLHALRRRNKELGVAAICGGGGVTTALVLRAES